MTLSIILALRDDSGDQFRSRLWNFLEPHYRAAWPEAEICIGTDDGEDPFHKTIALNRAVQESSGEWLLITDSDMWVPPAQVQEAQELAVALNTWGRPWNLKVKMGQMDTDLLLNTPNWDGEIEERWNGPGRRENLNTYWAAPPLLIRRSHYDLVGGFDERFRGWGQEDEAFALALRCLVGKPKVVLGWAVHLWHPRRGKSGHDTWVGQDDPQMNKPLVRKYQNAVTNPKLMRDLIEGRYESV